MVSNKSTSLMGVVPQISYDIIARVIPGIAIIIVWVLVYSGPTQSYEKFTEYLISPTLALSFGGFIILALFGYLVSISLFGTSFLIQKIIRTLFRPSKIISEIEPLSNNASIRNLKNPTTALMYDFIRMKSPEAGARLVKLRAEYDLSRTLIIGLVIATIYNIFPIINYSSIENIGTEIILLLAIIGFISFGNFIEKRYNTSLKNHWHILKTQDDSKQEKKKR